MAKLIFFVTGIVFPAAAAKVAVETFTDVDVLAALQTLALSLV